MTLLKGLEINNFKGFSEVKNKIEFAIPNGSLGSGITFIVGPNNSGKTTVFEALMKALSGNAQFYESDFHKFKSPKIVISQVEGEHNEDVILTKAERGSSVQVSGKLELSNHDFTFLEAFRHWDDRFGGEFDFNNLNHSHLTRYRPRTFQKAEGIGDVLSHLTTSEDARLKFDSLLKILMPEFETWEVVQTDADNPREVMYTTTNGIRHRVKYLGSGTNNLFYVALKLSQVPEGSIFLFDEPENSLHPQVQKKLFEILLDMSKTSQIILCTHSPYFIDWKSFQNGAKLVRLIKSSDGVCEVYQLEDIQQYERVMNASSDIQKPQQLDLVAKELFFSKGVVFLEGAEDKSVFSQYFLQNVNEPIYFDFFGYGVGGADNMEAYLQMAVDLNIKAAVILDADRVDLCKELKRKFPECLIKTIEADDISRDKNGTPGLVTYSNGEVAVREEYRKGFEALVQKIVDYFKV